MNKKKILFIAIPFVIIAALLGGWYFYVNSQKVYIETASISAATISLAPKVSGQLSDVFVKAGDEVDANTAVARVGNDLVKAKVAGIILTVRSDEGATIAPGQSVATMIDKNDLRVEGQLEEDKGLSDVTVGQQAYFTVDAYSGKTYYGIVDEVSPVSSDASLTFNISDKRAEKNFTVKVRFDLNQYPELKPGMSAQVWVIK